MKAQLITLFTMLVLLVLFVPFPDSDSIRSVFTNSPMNTFETAVNIASSASNLGSLPDAQSISGDQAMEFDGGYSQDESESSLDPSESGSRAIRAAGLEEYQIEYSDSDIQGTQLSRFNQHCVTPKNGLFSASIHGNARPARQGFGFNDIRQKRFPRKYSNHFNQTLLTYQVPYSAMSNWSLPSNGPSGSIGQSSPPNLDDMAFRESDQLQDEDRRQPPSISSLSQTIQPHSLSERR